ncbi:MAG: metal ABC transporter substrate-binding protein [Oscillospiraceae bacterium]
MSIKHLLCWFLTSTALLSGCSAPVTSSIVSGDTQHLSVVATLFPQYDFAKAIAGERANVTLLLPPGVESHSFEPTPVNAAVAHSCDVFLYTGDQMEPWASHLAADLPASVTVCDLSQGIPLSGGETAKSEAHGNTAHEHTGADPHIWTSPANASIMVDSIVAALTLADPGGAAVYSSNANAYKNELVALDQSFLEVVQGGKRNQILFGGRFALHYFAKRYGLSVLSAFDSCSAETEPSARAVADIIDTIRTEQIPVIYRDALDNSTIADAIAEETGVRILTFYSCHNLSKIDLEAGETYLSLMRKNVASLKEGLS